MDITDQKKKPDRIIDENKHLSSRQIMELRSYCTKQKEKALKERKLSPVRDWFMIELGLFCGLRVSEMVNLKESDVSVNDMESALIVRRGKGGKARVVHFSDSFKKIYRIFLNHKRSVGLPAACDDSFVMTSSRGEKLTRRALQKAFKRSLKGAGIDDKYGIHCLRHTYATHLYKASGYNLRLVQRQLGHASIKTTQIYADVFDEDMKKAVEKLYKK